MPPKTPALKGTDLIKKDAMKVFGNYFVPEMRTVCALLELNDVLYSSESIDIFTEMGMKEYGGLNPTE
jgi:glutathione S-transferase